MFPQYDYNSILKDIQEFNKNKYKFYNEYKYQKRTYDYKLLYIFYVNNYYGEKLNRFDNDFKDSTLRQLKNYFKNKNVFEKDKLEIIKIIELVKKVEDPLTIVSLKGEEYKWFEPYFVDLLHILLQNDSNDYVRIENFELTFSEIRYIVNVFLITFFENFIEVYKKEFFNSDVNMHPFTHFFLFICKWEDMIYLNEMRKFKKDSYFLSLLIAKTSFNVSTINKIIIDEKSFYFLFNFGENRLAYTYDISYLLFKQYYALNILYDFSCLYCKINTVLPFFLIIESIEEIYHLINDDLHKDCKTSLNKNFKYDDLKKLDFSKIIDIISTNEGFDLTEQNKNLVKFVLAYMIIIDNYDKIFLSKIINYNIDGILEDLYIETKELKNEIQIFSKYKKSFYKVLKSLNNDECSECLSIYNLQIIDNKYKCLDCQALSDSCNNCLKVVKKLSERNKDLEIKKTCSICLNKIKDVVFVPCGHTCCSRCSRTLNSCHLCRKEIDSKYQLFIDA